MEHITALTEKEKQKILECRYGEEDVSDDNLPPENSQHKFPIHSNQKETLTPKKEPVLDLSKRTADSLRQRQLKERIKGKKYKHAATNITK